ncbi:DNA-directed RNA polymerase III subunit Rpc31-domain-containing protein [Paraphoma chrysanthemicola]|uniref:DNA-directed RNA polymerase III subunit Rpc31-domain-containing protein n=1 Tax=Paraphoma chrysanthemicola TaxID=798071 RepID=A0A8K0R9K1_9PLEO|nr:DNA-directed RNA polymerase III subunit Rpc31-domain-containing protein [Paraphoma chrysanthemicola]
MPPARGGGGRGGGRGGRGGAFNPGRGTVTIAGTELNWDLTGLDIQRGPAERFPPVYCAAPYHVVPAAMSRQPPESQSQPSASTLRSAPSKHPLRRQQEAPPPQAPPPTAHERGIVSHYLRARDRIHEGPFYTILNDGMKNGLKRKASEPAPTEASLFNPFTDNQTYSAKYLKVRRRLPKLDARPYVTDLFPTELRPILDSSRGDNNSSKKRRVLGVTKINAVSQIERMIKAEVDRTNEAEARAEDELDEDAEDDEVEADDDKPDAVDEEDNWSAVSTDSEESDDDYNAEQYFDNGEDDDIDDADPYENTYE